MCRYGMSGPYKKHFACFTCRKAFKRFQEDEWPDTEQPAVGEVVPAPFPDCGRPMADMGLDFKAPKQRETERWEVAEHLFRHGFAYHSCGCGGPGYRPSRWEDVPAFLASQRSQSPGGILATRFATRGAVAHPRA